MIPKSNCPYCFATLWDDNPGFKPEKDMLCICAFCGEVCMLNEKLRLTKPEYIPDDVKAKSMLTKLSISIGFDVNAYIRDFKVH